MSPRRPLHPSDNFGTRDYGPIPGWIRVVELTRDGALVSYYRDAG